VVNGEMSLRRLKLSIYEVVKPTGGGEGGEVVDEEEDIVHGHAHEQTDLHKVI
jgi:hypothetical protein